MGIQVCNAFNSKKATKLGGNLEHYDLENYKSRPL